MANQQKSFYQRLTRLFRSGPAIRRKVKGQDYKNFYDNQVVQNNLGYYGASGFKREASPFSVMGAYGILDRMSRYCLTGETEVATNSKKGTVRMDELAKMFSGEKPSEPIHTFAYDQKTNSIVLAEIENAFFTKEAEITEVELDNGKIVRCTADHRFMLRDGSYVQAQNLKNGDALMPFYRKNLKKYKNGNIYRVIYSPSDGWCGEHKIVGNYLFGRKILSEDNKHVHHKNFCGIDNVVNNLEVMDKNEHMLMHARDGQRSSDRKSAYWDKKLQGNPSINSLKFTGRKKKDRIKQTVRYEKCIQPKYKNPNADNDFTIDNILANWTPGITSQALAKKCGVHYGKFFARLKWAGYGNYAEFIQDKCDSHYKLNHKNPRKISDLPKIQQIYSLFKEGKTQRKIAQELNENVSIILSTIRKNGFPTWQSFITEYKNHKVVSVKNTGIIEKVYDITVKDYHNFAINQGVIVHNSEFSEMENTAEIATALNVYADESCATDEKGKTFHIYSENAQVQKALEELFYEVVNIEFNARRMVRNLVKNGDYFCYVEVVPDFGVINVEPLPVNEIEREEGFDKHDPYAVRYRLITRGGKYLENWQMLHFRILGNDLFLPYGTSFLESARRSWRQLCHLSGTRVLTEVGYKNIEDVTSGETVYTHCPELKSTVKARVKHIVDMGVQNIVSVETSHRTIKVTPNHGLLVKNKNGDFIYKKAIDLIASDGKGGNSSRNSDKLVLPSIISGEPALYLNFNDVSSAYSVKLINKAANIERKGIVNRLKNLGASTGYKNIHSFLNGDRKISWADYQLVKKEFDLTDPVKYYYKHSKKESLFFDFTNQIYSFDKDFIKFFGFMLGDGWVNKNGLGFALGIYDQQNEEYINYAAKIFGEQYSYSRRAGTKSAQVNWDNTEAAHIFRHLDFKTGFASKHIPNWVYNLNLECRRSLIQGMFDADGCDNTGTICFANRKLIEQTQELCWTIGIPVGKTITVRPERPGHKESYRLWMDLSKESKDVVYENVLRVTEQENGQTWDLEVEHEEHNFIANGIVTHNTMMEDAMMVYRLVRSPERRVFYIDVSAVHPNDIPSYMEAVKEGMRGASVIEQQQGRQDFRYNPLPVHKDTGIPLLDGRTITIEELAKEYDAGKENWVYSIQDSSLGIVPGKVAWCGKNYTANKLIKITLDDGTSLKTAPEHPYVLRDGSSVRADQLITGMSLMPLYREITDKGYERCYNPETQKYETTHSLVAKNFYQNEWQNTERPVVHHKCPWERETNKRNNSPKNLEVMNFWEHRELHAKMIEHTLLRPEILEENSRRLTRYNRSKLHSSRVSLNNIKYQKGQKLSQLYNGSDLHKEHNEIRKNAQFNSWLLNKAERCQAMKFKFTEKCLEIAKDIMAANPTISRDDFGAKLKNNIDFVTSIKEANSNTKRQNKIPNHRVLAQNISNYAGFDSYVEFKNSFSSAKYLNHKISTVETVTETVDVYCMTVIGPNGEEDRHNFAAMSNDESGNYNKKMSAVFLKNSVDEDYFLPTRPNNQTKIESIAGGQNTTATEDVEYIQKKLIAALMVPKAYLTYDEAISCLVGETQIPLLDGSSPTIKELSDKFANGELTEAYCYSTLLDGTVVPGKINKAWATKKVNSTYRIHLDNGEYIDCTENHPFLLKNGVYKRADELTVNDSLMPVYKKLSSKQDKDLLDGYEMVFDNKTGEWKYTHKMVSDWQAENNGGYTIGKQRVVHHIDFNKLNNSPKNLQEMTWYSHRKLHSQNLSSTILRPDVMIKREPSRLAALSASRHRNIKSRQMKQQMNDPKSALRSWVHGEEIKQVVSRNMKAAWSTEKYRSIKTKQNKEILQRPEVREKLFGKNHWAARATKHFDLNWLVEYCKQNNVTEYLHFRKSSQNNSPCSSRVVGRIFRENNISGWREFEKQYLYFNHKVIRIEIKECGDEATQGVWVYDLEVEKTHNFLIKQGVVVHNSKSTLAQEDIRFSRTIATLQKIMIAELNKLAIIHLYALGFSGDDLLNFELKFSNPSTVAVQQKLALVSQKIEIAAKAWEVSKETGIMSMPYIQKEILGLRPEEINQIRLESRQDQIAMAELKKIAENPPFDNSLDSNIDIFDKGNYSVPSSPFAPDPKQLRDIELKNQEDELALRRERKLEKEKNGESSGAPIKLNPTPNLDKAFRRNKRSKEFTGASALAMPNFKDMLDITNNRYSKDPYDTQSSNYTRKFVLEESQIENELLGRGKLPYKISKEMQSTLKTMNESMKRDFEIKGIELVNEKSSEDQSDMLFLIEKDLKTE